MPSEDVSGEFDVPVPASSSPHEAEAAAQPEAPKVEKPKVEKPKRAKQVVKKDDDEEESAAETEKPKKLPEHFPVVEMTAETLAPIFQAQDEHAARVRLENLVRDNPEVAGLVAKIAKLQARIAELERK